MVPAKREEVSEGIKMWAPKLLVSESLTEIELARFYRSQLRDISRYTKFHKTP